MNAAPARTHRTLLARLVFLVGLLLALLLAFGGQSFRLGRSRPIASAGGQGYWLVAKDGGVFGYGDAVHHGANLNSGNDVIAIAATPTMQGYWTVDDDGTVFAYGDAHDYGSRVSTVDDIRGFASRPQGDGYWLVNREGVVTAKGAAVSFGNAPALGATQKIVGMAPTPSGNGYWLVGRDGGIFAFGDAGFYGSTGAIVLNQPIVGMARSASGHGYRFVAADGGVFSFGDAAFYGSTGANPPASGITGIAPTASGNGYWLVAGNGKVFPFGDAVSYGDASGLTLRQPIIGIAATPLVHVNSVPAPVADSASVAEDGSGSFNVIGNDAGLDDGPITVAIVSGPAHGSASVGGDRKINYSPAANYNGSDSITYRVTDADGESASAVLSLTVTAVNDTPSVQNGSLVTSEDAVAGGTFIGSDIDGNGLTYSVVAAPAHGSVVVSGSSYTYTPATDYNGSDSFTFRANDGSANSNTGTVSISVAAVNDAPLVSDVSLSTDEDTPFSASASGVDAENDELSFGIVSQPTLGVLSSGGDGSYTYTPNPNVSGTDSFTYQANDGVLDSNIGTVTITITAVDDPAVAEDGTLTTDEDVPAGGTLASGDVDGGNPAYVVVSGPTHGSISGLDPVTGDYTYTPAANFHGEDSFTFAAQGDPEASAPATVSINVGSIEDAPAFADGGVGTGTGGFIDVASPETDLGDHGDDGDLLVDVPFPLSYYGATYDQPVRISANGWIALDGAGYSYDNGPLSSVSGPMIAAFWDDLRTDSGDNHGIFARVIGESPNRQWVVQWNVTHYGTGGATVRFEAIFTENSPVVELHYNDVVFGHSADFGGEATVGLVKDAATRSQFSFDEPSLSNFLFLRYDTSTNTSSVGTDNDLTTDEDAELGLDVPATDGDNDPLTYSVSDPAHGEATIDSTGHVTYTPDENYNGDDTFTVSVTDSHSDPVTKDVTVTVTPVNDAPVITGGDSTVALTVDEDDADGASVTLAATDIDAGDSLSWSADDPAHGTVTNTGGMFTYVPDANFDGTESFTATASDGHGGTDTVRVDVTITNLNDDTPVVSAIDSQSMDEDTTLEIPFTVGDPDTGDVLTVTVGSSDPTLLPAGSLVVTGTDADRILTVTPAANLNGEAHVFVMVSDGETSPVLQDIVLTVRSVNDLPVANAGNLSTGEDTTGTGNLTGDDPVEHSPLSFSLVGDNGGAEHGTVTITNANTGAYSYVPDGNWNGNDSFQFVASDGDASEPATISVTVAQAVDAPVFDGTGNSGSGDEETLITGTVHATDPDLGDTLTYTIGTGDGAADGDATVNETTGAWTYTGHDDFAGDDSFTITVTDGDDLTDTIVVNVGVLNVNDAPVFDLGGNGGIGNEEAVITDTVHATDADLGDSLTYGIEDGSGAADGTATVDEATGEWSYIGNLNFFGTDSFTITVSDGHGGSATLPVNVTVNNVNDAPVFDPGGNSGIGNEEALISGTVHAADAENDGLTYSIEVGDGADSGIATVDDVTGEWSYTGNLNFFGTDSFTITVSDGHGGSATIPVNVTVDNVNDLPIVSAIGTQSTNEDTPLVIPFTVADADPGDVLGIHVGSSNPTLLPAGALTVADAGGNDRTLTVNSPLNLNGTAQVFLSVSDGHAAPVVQSFLLTVNAIDDAPVIDQGAGPLPLSVSEDDGNGEQVTVSATDVENDSITWSASDPAHGTVANLGGVFTYTPDADFDGSESFTITANDGHSGTDTIQVNVTITPSADAPSFATASVSASGDEETAITGSLPATDPDTGDTLTYSIEDGDEPTNGTAGVDAATGSWSYSGNLNFAGSDSFTITVTDGDDLTDAVVVDLTVANVNDAPVATGTTINPTEDDPVATSGSVSATDADGDSVTFSLGTPAAKGTADVNADGTFTYLPTAGQTGADSFTVTASDGHGGTDTATVMVDILGQGPVIDVANSDVTPVMDPLFIATGHIAASDPDDDPLTYSIDGNPAGIMIDGSGNYVYDGTVAGPNFFTVRVSDGTHDATQMVIVSSSPL